MMLFIFSYLAFFTFLFFLYDYLFILANQFGYIKQISKYTPI